VACVINFDDYCGRVLRGEVAKGGGGDAVVSSTTSDKEIARNPRPPGGLRRKGPISLLRLLDDGQHRLVADASNSTPFARNNGLSKLIKQTTSF
jgi:hypothetical protein